MKAYAARLNGEVLLNTVFQHPRGAMVNFLYTQTAFRPTNDWSDETIRDVFQVAEQAMNVQIVELDLVEASEVNISEGAISF